MSIRNISECPDGNELDIIINDDAGLPRIIKVICPYSLDELLSEKRETFHLVRNNFNWSQSQEVEIENGEGDQDIIQDTWKNVFNHLLVEPNLDRFLEESDSECSLSELPSLPLTEFSPICSDGDSIQSDTDDTSHNLCIPEVNQFFKVQSEFLMDRQMMEDESLILSENEISDIETTCILDHGRYNHVNISRKQSTQQSTENQVLNLNSSTTSKTKKENKTKNTWNFFKSNIFRRKRNSSKLKESNCFETSKFLDLAKKLSLNKSVCSQKHETRNDETDLITRQVYFEDHGIRKVAELKYSLSGKSMGRKDYSITENEDK
ncbi:hypothetical protein SNEBB_004293 [Seison nebaliae]|nr:hypothetical protein SNEBB_004293 [Seison nebaliae]